MAALGTKMTIADVNTFLEVSGADREARDIVDAAGVKISSDLPQGQQGYRRAVNVMELREDLLLKLERERSGEVAALRQKQKQIMADKRGREAELMELQKAEESHRDLLLKDRDERNKIAQDLRLLKRGYLVDMEEEARRELASLQRERELLQAKEKDNSDAIDEMRRQIMEQDEVYHRAMEEAQKKVKDGKTGVDNDGRPLVDHARSQRQAIQSEQVALAEMYGKKAGALRQEQARLQQEIQSVNGRIKGARKKGGEAPRNWGADDALAALMSEAGMAAQAARLQKLKGELEKEHAEDVSGGFIKEYEGAAAETWKALKNKAKLEGRAGEYAEAAADAFLDDWLKTDADRAREAAAVAATSAATSAAESSSSSTLAKGTEPVARGQGGATHKRRRSSHNEQHHLPRHDRSHRRAGRPTHDGGRSPHGPARAGGSSSEDSDGGRPDGREVEGGASQGNNGGGVGDGGGARGHPTSGLPYHRRNAATGPLCRPLVGLSPDPTARSQENPAERGNRTDDSGNPAPAKQPQSRDNKGHRKASGAGRIGDADAGTDAVADAEGQSLEEQALKQPVQAEEADPKPREIPRRVEEDAAKLRATVERLESELSSFKTGGAGIGGWGNGFGSTAADWAGGFGLAPPAAGYPWVPAPGLQQHLASLDAENARMMAEIQGLAVGGGVVGGPFGMPGLSGHQYVGAGVAGRGEEKAGQAGGNEDSGELAQKQKKETTGGQGIGAEWDATTLGPAYSGEPLTPRIREYRRKMIEMDAEHKEAVKRLEFEMQRLELEQQLEDMRERMAREKKTRQQDVAHEQWVTEQKRNLQALKIEKTLAKERQLMEVQQTLSGPRGGWGGRNHDDPSRAAMQVGAGWRPGVGGIVQRPYNKDNGFCVFWDYLTGLPKRSGSKAITKVRLAFGLYIGKRLYGKMQSTLWTDISADSTVTNEITGRPEVFAKLETRSAFPGIPLHVHTKLVVELQFKDMAGVQGKGAKGNLGWGCIYVFKAEQANVHRLTVRAGLTRLTIFPGSVDLRIANVNDNKSAVSRSTPTAAFIRLVHGEDVSPAGVFVVDPDTHHLYTAYGRGNIPQFERQKLMAGTFLRAIYFLGKLKRALVSDKRSKTLGGETGKGGRATMRRRISLEAQPREVKPPTAPDNTKPDERAGSGDVGGRGQERAGSPKENPPTPEREDQAGTSASDDSRRDSVEEELSGTDSGDDSEEDDRGRDDDDKSAPQQRQQERRRSSLSSLQSQLAGQKAMARRVSLSNRRQSTVSRRPFLKGDGFDFYLDRACGMPHPCTVSKVTVKAVGDVGNQGDFTEVSHADSPSGNPVFGLLQEFRTGPDDRMDMTSTLTIRVDTIDRASSEQRVVGYAEVPIFMDSSGRQPKSAQADGAYLREGNFQVPLYRKPPDKRRAASRSANDLLRVPCASVLVRVKPASKSPAGKTLSRADIPEAEWKKFGLALPIPQFASGVYDNSAFALTDVERQILELRAKDGQEELVGETGKLIKSPQNPAPAYSSEDDNEAFEEWIEKVMVHRPLKAIEYHRSEKYRTETGFSVKVAGLTNMKSPGTLKPARLYKVIFSLSKPGLFYLGNPKAAEQADFTQSYDLRSSQMAPRFEELPHVFRNQPIDNDQCIVLDVRFLKVDRKGLAAVPEDSSVAPPRGAWGLLPAFAAGDLAIGTFIVPLLSGPIPTEVIKSENPMKFMMDRVRSKHPNYRVVEGSSVIVQVCNALLPEALPPATQDPSLNYICVKRVTDALGMLQDKYVFDHVDDAGPKAMARIVPKGKSLLAFFTAANTQFAKAAGMVYVTRELILTKKTS